ncbi:DUF5955 family protein [Rhizohabitans arisaemae]|uniref:DUF5955 family protein n=1 Tax=Rhizohabitans arisaemae TaxID=2720610 RepID=UPI0024B26750|nr:DUF5955 family protein [Rhizohabitans arisaemae]
MADNYGIQITGGTVSGPMAVGPGATAVQNTGAGTAELDAVVAELRELIRRHRDEIEDPGEAERDLDDIAAEARSERPGRRRLTAALNRLAEVGVLADGIAKLTGILPL